MDPASVTVVGQVARDLVLLVDGVPVPGGSTSVRERREVLGGKGANIAVGAAQLGGHVTLVGVVGDDDAGNRCCAQAERDGLDVTHVVRRIGEVTALMLDVVDKDGTRRLFEDVGPQLLLTAADVERAADSLTRAATVVLQLQQPADAVLAAARLARGNAARIVMDGAPDDEAAGDELLRIVDVVRADQREAEMLTGRRLDGVMDAVDAAHRLLERGPRLVALAAGDAGNVLAWPGGSVVLPLGDAPVVDTTGAGDAFVAGLVMALATGGSPAEAGRLAAKAAAATVSRLGGRPDLAGAGLLPIPRDPASRPA